VLPGGIFPSSVVLPFRAFALHAVAMLRRGKKVFRMLSQESDGAKKVYPVRPETNDFALQAIRTTFATC
jgi:hypothetical protein